MGSLIGQGIEYDVKGGGGVFPLMLPLSPWQSIHISGTSSKLGRNIAFHHCTLLLDVDEVLLKSLLHPSYVSFF